MSLRALHSTILFALLFGLLLIVPTVKAENGQTYQVGTSNLNIRTAPSNSAEVVGQLGYGDQVVVFSESNGWGQTYYDGKEAWVALHYLYIGKSSKQAVSPAATPTNLTIAANSVRIRSGPSTSYDMIGSTIKGQSFKLLDTKDEWHQIALSNGKTGWIAGWLTNLTADANDSATTNDNPTNTVAVSATPNTKGNQSLAGYNIVLDPGHGGKDSGAISLDGSYEKDLVLTTAHVIAQRLEDAGATVIMT